MTLYSKYTRALTFENLFQAIASHFRNAAGDPLWLAIGMLVCVVCVVCVVCLPRSHVLGLRNAVEDALWLTIGMLVASMVSLFKGSHMVCFFRDPLRKLCS